MKDDTWEDVWTCPQCGLQGDYDIGTGEKNFCPLCEYPEILKQDFVIQQFKDVASLYDREIDVPEKYYDLLWEREWYTIIMLGGNVSLRLFRQIFDGEY